ncbi:hypothetical protein HPP92_004095 [Vanilla planifolia]|uniref:Myb-like domain-containing protein n=1 Tax=Vanilla planifolia TaxID=51239 RepID=A0A835VP49_VANPL|nr:hypothetical protein HPP92_004530 [Vanilla planifolia]KAG0504023.1 hypothetical protein HPP92_004095 [Vanilla planifolia]
MGTNANSCGSQDGSHGVSSSLHGVGDGGGLLAGGNTESGAASMASSSQALKHDPGLMMDWTTEEQATLEELLNKYASDPSVIRYAKIAKQLPEKTVRDVALRSRWMTKKESGKRRKDDNISRKNKDKKERSIDSSSKPSSHLGARSNLPSYSIPMLPMDNDDDISYAAIGGSTGQLLEHTAQIFSQISGNFTNFQVNDNIGLFCQARDNILKVMNELNDIPGVMEQMPQLPVKLNEELANTILPLIVPRMQMPPPPPQQT